MDFTIDIETRSLNSCKSLRPSANIASLFPDGFCRNWDVSEKNIRQTGLKYNFLIHTIRNLKFVGTRSLNNYMTVTWTKYKARKFRKFESTLIYRNIYNILIRSNVPEISLKKFPTFFPNANCQYPRQSQHCDEIATPKTNIKCPLTTIRGIHQ